MTNDLDETLSPALETVIETQLQSIIAHAREVAVVAEELLREIVQSSGNEDLEESASTGWSHTLSMAPRLLASTEQQLVALLSSLQRAQK